MIGADRGISVSKVFELLTREGIALVAPFRKPNQHVEQVDLRCDRFDEDGVPRCRHCGGPGYQEGAGLGLKFVGSARKPVIKYRCDNPVFGDCLTKAQSVPCELCWQPLLPISRMTERYHAVLQATNNLEHVHRHARERYGYAGFDWTGRLKKTGIGAQQLRAAAGRFLEWFRLCLRHGWLDGHPTLHDHDVLQRSGEHGLKRLQRQRVGRGLPLPYGAAAIAAGLIPDPNQP